MASNPAQKSDTVLDPTFFIPEGAAGFRYDDKDWGDSANEVDGEGGDPGSKPDFFIDDGNEDDAGYPDTPEIVGVIEPQTIDSKSWGQQVIDVLLEVDDVAGDVKYEYRITKV